MTGEFCSSFGILILLLSITASPFVTEWFFFLNTFAGRGCYFLLCVLSLSSLPLATSLMRQSHVTLTSRDPHLETST
jgi:hypothetical protein